jgi:hypothetical protein
MTVDVCVGNTDARSVVLSLVRESQDLRAVAQR